MHSKTTIFAYFLLIFLLGASLTACNQAEFPRPKGYPRINIPPVEYQLFESPECPFTFEYPTYGKVQKVQTDSCMVDLYFEDYDFHWYLTYRNIPDSKKRRAVHEEEYRKLVMRHTIKINHLTEKALSGPNGSGVLYELYGRVGAPAQLFYGDNINLVMTSFYFSRAINQDSLRPVIEQSKKDLQYMAESLKWLK